MSKKADAFYFDNFKEVAEICSQAANYLVDCFSNYDINEIETRLQKMHEYEHSADIKRHKMTEALSKAFITPLEREDLAELSSNLDEVADNIEAVYQRFYMDQPKLITKESLEFSKIIVTCCDAMVKMFEELPNYKKPAKLMTYVVQLNDLEEECDVIYLNAYRNLKNEIKDVYEVIAYREIYNYLEKCADACEHVADIVANIVMKNS